jgi:hypothetical protein
VSRSDDRSRPVRCCCSRQLSVGGMPHKSRCGSHCCAVKPLVALSVVVTFALITGSALIIEFGEVVFRGPAEEVAQWYFGLSATLMVGGVSCLTEVLYPQLEAWFDRRSRSATALAGEPSWQFTGGAWWAAGWPPDGSP